MVLNGGRLQQNIKGKLQQYDTVWMLEAGRKYSLLDGIVFDEFLLEVASHLMSLIATIEQKTD